MVQLKLSLPSPKTYLPSEFQFHDGTIKTEMRANGVLAQTAFQFHNGTIKTHKYGHKQGRIRISIP